MGMMFSRLWASLFGEREYKVIVVGLNNAGKTTTLYKLLLEEVVYSPPTIGSNVEEYTYKNVKFVIWDIGGQQQSRSTWSTYFVNTHNVMLVIDSTDKERLSIVKEELYKMLANENLKDAVFLILANKQDRKGAMSAVEISDALALHTIKDHDWHIQACCALTGEGLYQGMDWVVQHIKRK